MQVILYSKPDCPLCEDVKADLLSIQVQLDFTLFERNIEEDPELFARFRYLIPVVDIEHHALLYPPHTWHAIYTALRTAQQRDQAHRAQQQATPSRGKGQNE
ncbi:MAG: glutaredoxin family protein [Caldilineaceae bacterium]|nr:glutaredoxin family protein [Caldilineaceae bacterium]